MRLGKGCGRCGLSVATIAVALLATWCLFAADAAALTCTWNQSGAAAYDGSTAFWSCGRIPSSTDDVVFSSAGTGTCTVNPTVAHVLSWSMNAGAGTVNLGSSVTTTIDGAFTQSAGVFNAGTKNMSVGGAFTLSGTGDFTSTSGRLEVGGAFTQTGGTFRHGSGRLMLSARSGTQNFATNSSTFYDVIINDGLQAYWKLDETSGTSAGDSTGYTGTLTYGTAPTQSTTLGPSLDFPDPAYLTFNGSSTYASVASPGRLDFASTESYTVAAWVKATNLTNASPQGIITNSSETAAGYGLWITALSGGPRWLSLSAGQSATGAVVTNAWHHVAIVQNVTANRQYVYVDGVDTSTAATFVPKNGNGSTTLYIGRSFAGEYFTGSIDDVRIYDRALTTAELLALTAGGVPSLSAATQTVTGNPIIARDLTILTGTLAGGNTTIQVGGSWKNYGGVFTTGATGLVNFNGTGLTNVIRAANSAFNDVTVSGTGTWTIEDETAVTISNDLLLSAGTLVSTAGRLEVGGAFTDSGGAFTHSSGQVMLNSIASETFAAGDTTFYNLTINDGLVGYWKLDENTGTSIADSSGYGNTGTLVSGPSWVSGASLQTLKFNDIAGLSFDGTNDYATLGVNDFPALNGAKTVAFWAYWASKPSSSYNMVALMSGAPGVQIGFNGSSQLIKVWSGATIYAASATTATSGWHHIAYTYDGTTNILYIDGLSAGTSATAPTSAATATAWLGTYNGSNELFAGRLDDVRIYKRALSATEINSLAIGRQPASYLAVQGMTGAPTIANDLVIASGLLSVGNNALTIGGNWWNYGGVFRAGSSEAITFNGSTTGKYIRSGGHVFQDITINGTGGWTLADDLEVERNKTLFTTAGTLDLSSYTFRGGQLDKTVNITPSTSTVVLNSTANRTLKTTTYNNLRIEVPETSLVGYWKFDQGEGPLAWDYASSQHQGTLTNGPLWVNSGLPSAIEFVNQGAIDFDGTNDYVDVAAAVTPTNAAFTACAWGNLDVLSGDETMVGIDGTTVAAWKLRRNGTDGKFSMRYYASDITGASAVAAGGSTSPVAGTWYHVCGVYSGSAVSLYVNGLLEGGPTTVSTPWSATNHTVIGAGKYNGAYIDPWNGKLDDVRIYNVALSATQIAALAAGRYTNAGTSVTYTAGASTTVAGTFAIDSGTYDTSTGSYGTTITGAGYVNTGTLSITGSASNVSTISVNTSLTVRNAGTVNMTTAGSRIKLANATSLVMDGTLNASNAGALIINQTNGAAGSNYSFTVGSTATATPTLNISGLTVKSTDTNGMYINAVAGSSTTFTQFDNIAFANGTGNYLLRVYGTSLGLYGSGLTFDASTTYNARLTGNGTGDGETRAYLGATCTNTPCESYDVDDDSEPDGTGDTAVLGDEAVIQWMRGAYNDTAGTIQGFPTTAFDWNTFTYWNTYVAYRDYSGTTDRLFARDTDGAFKTTAGGTGYYYDFATGVGDIMGTPRWTTEGTGGSTVHYVYVLTSLGNVYKLIDSGTAFTLVTAQAWPYRNGASATATSSLAIDSSNVYWAGNDGTGAKKMFSLTTAKVLNGTRTVVADVVAALSVATVSSTAYLFTGTNGQIYRTPLDLASELTSAQATSTVYGRVTIVGGVVYFPEDIGKVWALSATTLATSWSYQDTVTTAGRHPGGCTANSQCTVRNLYVETSTSRSYFGDKDGHVYVLSSAGALVTNYPYRPGASTDEFQSAPFYRSGVIIVGSTTGKVFIIDQNNGTGPAVYQTFNFQSAVSTVGYDTDGYYMVGTADGKLYYLNGITDPTPGSI